MLEIEKIKETSAQMKHTHTQTVDDDDDERQMWIVDKKVETEKASERQRV